MGGGGGGQRRQNHTPSIAFRHLPPKRRKDVVNQCLEFAVVPQCVLLVKLLPLFVTNNKQELLRLVLEVASDCRSILWCISLLTK